MSAYGWIWNFVLLIGCGYVVFGLGRSPWWFLLVLVFLCSSGKASEEENDD